jgi:toxin FitB
VFLLDTNVVFEMMRPAPEPRVVTWLDGQLAHDVWISAVTAGEIRLGLAFLPDGRRKRRLSDLAELMLREEFGDRCLPYDLLASADYATIVAARRRRGLPMSVEDAQIAAIARSAALTIVTRNAKHFAGIDGVSVVNPWE